MYIHTYIHTYTHNNLHIHTYTVTHIHTYAHTHIHTYIHTLTNFASLSLDLPTTSVLSLQVTSERTPFDGRKDGGREREHKGRQ